MTITQAIQVSRKVDYTSINGTSGSRNGNGVLVTAANEYAILNVCFGNSSPSPQIFAIGLSSQSGVNVVQPNTIISVSVATSTAYSAVVYIPPNSEVWYGTTDVSTGPALSRISISGPVFINTTS